MVTLAPAATARALDGDAMAVTRLQGEPRRHRRRLELGQCTGMRVQCLSRRALPTGGPGAGSVPRLPLTASVITATNISLGSPVQDTRSSLRRNMLRYAHSFWVR